MPIDFSRVNYTGVNVLRSLDNWDILSGAAVSTNTITINPGGYAGNTLKADRASGLSASSYAQLRFTISVPLPAQPSNTKNIVCVELSGILAAGEDSDTTMFFKSINLSTLGGSLSGSIFSGVIDLVMPNRTFDSLAITVHNNSVGVITLLGVQLLRSQDVSSDQVGGSIGWGVPISGFIGYRDGFEVVYSQRTTKDKLKFMFDDKGVFNGVNVNGERMITYEYRDEELTL